MKIVAIIPARLGSKRLPKKNIRSVLGKPLVGWVIESAADAIGLDNVYVSTESDEVAEVAAGYGAQIVERPKHLARDSTLTEPVIQHALKEIEKDMGRVDIVLWLNASLPEITGLDINLAIDKLRAENLWEVMTLDANYNCTSAVRVICREALDHKGLSVYCGVVPLNYTDIHYEEDLEIVEEIMRERSKQCL